MVAGMRLPVTDKLCTRCGNALKPQQRFRRAMCPTCYRRWVEDPANRGQVNGMNRPLVERVKERSAPQPNGCVHWTGHLNANGYGKISVDKTMRLAHRALYQELNGKLPDDTLLDHTCHNEDRSCSGGPTCLHRRCVNPEHLEPVSNKVNQERSINTAAGRSAIQNECARGHEYTPENTYTDKHGWKRCRTCDRRRADEARSAPGRPSSIREFCRNGHRMTEENTLVRGRSTRCRKCAAEVSQRIRDRKKEL
jgi:hypothetical protein